MKKAILLASIMILIVSGASFAGINAEAKGWVHVLDHASRTCAKGFPADIDSCGDIIYTLAGQDADCFPVFWNMTEYQGFDFSLAWPGTYTCAYTSCSDLAIGTIINPGDGVSHAWYVCQNSSASIPGWGWIYDTGLVCLTDHPTAGGVIVGDCSTLLDTLPSSSYGCAGIGGTAGQNPCENSTNPTSWGDIKGLFK
jgi:hypothetical protein